MVTLVVLLDYSAAFDNVDHSVMLDILEWRCGLTDAALQWHKSYLHCRSYAVISGGAMSETTDLECGVPQGSCLGPMKFVVYAADLHTVTSRHSVKLHSFADDTQVYKRTSIGNVQQPKHDVTAAINDINRWSQSFKLKLNAQKSEVIWLLTRQQLAKLSQDDMTLQLPDGPLISQSTVRNLGVQLDSELGFDVQARHCVKSCYYHLRRISHIKRYIDQDCLRSLVHAFVTSRLDYCNSLYAHCNVSARQRLQRVQNRATRAVLNVPPRTPSLHLLRQLH